MKQLNFKKARLIFLLCLSLISYELMAQQKEVTGTVTDAVSNLGLPGVSVIVKGTTIGTSTDIDGKYMLMVPENAILVFSFVGYTTQEIAVGEQAIININLQEDVEALSEVVVIGYGQVKKEDATGSVTAVAADDFNKGAITTPQSLIVGKTAGVVVTTASGEPGAGATIRIRGGSSLRASNDPLIVIDGFPLDNTRLDGLSNPLSSINPNDIESMTILKDASATAIYGSRASNGVIIITTKKGIKTGLNISYNGNVSIGKIKEYIEVFDGNEFRNLVNDRVNNHGLTNFALTRLGTGNTDWQDKIYRTSISTDHNLSLYGNVANTPYRASIGHTIENGILKNSGNERTTLSINATPTFFDEQLKVNFNAKGMYIKNNFSNTDAIYSAYEFDPTQPIRNYNSTYGGYFAWVDLTQADQLNGLPINIATHNPLARLEYRSNKSDVKRFIGNIQFDYKIPWVPNLRANLNLGYDYAESDINDFTDRRASWSYREPAQNVKENSRENKNTLLDFYLNYTTEIDHHKIDATAGYGWQHFEREGVDFNHSWEKTNGVYDGKNLSGFKNENYLISFFGRVNYTYMDKYLLTATMRNDGSSRFSDDTRWGWFPALALAWKIDEESFMDNLEEFSTLKLRLGYGVTGQQDISDPDNPNATRFYYPYIPIYQESEIGAYYQFGDTYYSTLRPNPYDADIKWEETTTYNVGFDFGLFNDRLTGSFDYYKRKTEDLISEIPIAAGTNFSNFLITNVGSLENNGYEISLNYHIISRPDMSLEVGANLTHNENEITSLSNIEGQEAGYDLGDIAGGVGNTVQFNTVGHPANTFYLFKQVYDRNGMPIEGLYEDKTGLGGNVAGNNDNKYLMGTPAPEYLIGITSKFSYKRWDFSFAGRLSIDNYVYNNNDSNRALYQQLYNQAGYLSNIPKSVLRTNFTTAQYWSDFYLENASYFRMDNITLGYSFDKILSHEISGRVSATVQNAFVITDYTGLDPEVDGGIDDNIYPRPRIFMLALNLNF
jgi:iron complex outermembrane receptor protein